MENENNFRLVGPRPKKNSGGLVYGIGTFCKVKAFIHKLYDFYCLTGCSPLVWWQIIYINLLRKNTISKRHIGLLLARHCAILVDKSAQIEVKAHFVLGWKQFRSSRVETRLLIGEKASLVINGSFTAYSGSDIRILPHGRLTLNGGFCNDGVQITCGKKITIGTNCAIAREVIIRDYDAHQLQDPTHEVSKEIYIGDNVWIGTRAIILKGVAIGNGAVIAAGAVVTKDVPGNCLAAGIPARVIRENVTWQ
ncbi:MAG: acyltransferase [Elusimicrobiales bacterium]